MPSPLSLDDDDAPLPVPPPRGLPAGIPRLTDGFIPFRPLSIAESHIAGSPIDALLTKLASFHDNPAGFVHWAFPWGEAGTELASETGPEAWQLDQMVRIADTIRAGGANGFLLEEDIVSGHGIGKAHTLGMQIPTPLGTRLWGNLQPGDFVFGVDGTPTLVTHRRDYSQVPMYRVTFDDRSSCDVSSGHLWNVRGRQERRNGLDTWRTLETIQILEAGVKRPNGAALARQWEIPVQGAAQFEERLMALHPYVMGVWIGDGTMGQPQYTKPHAEVKARVEACGYEVHTQANGTTQRLIGVKDLFKGPVHQCYSHERYIPDDYKHNSIANRRALFDGLMDTDGEVCCSGAIGYATTSKRLADDVVWLARSLGCKAAIQPTVKKTWYPDAEGNRVECRDCYRITINAPFNPFTIAHRRDAYKPSERRYLVRWIESIEALPPEDGMCITVAAPDGLYQANDFIVTHNSCEVSWLILWAISTFPDTRGVVTANTEDQLRKKTWAELAKWYSLFIAKSLFKLTPTALHIANDHEREKKWRIDQSPWSKENTEAFAGLHNQGKRLVLIFDEASSIDDKVWEVARGALTDKRTQIIWARFGNPTRTSGEFYKQSTKPPSVRKGDEGAIIVHNTARVDARTVKFTNKALIHEWIEEYGEDSDFVRVRVRGLFPRAGYDNFISPGLVTQARLRRIHPDVYRSFPKVMSIDPARFGNDSTVITLRQGLKVHYQLKLQGFDGFDIAGRFLEIYRKEGGVSCVVYDAIGNGAELDGVLKRVPGLACPFVPIMWGQPAKDDKQYFNQRSEAWGKMRDWLEHGAIPDDDDLANQLTSVNYGHDMRMRIQLQSKKDIRKNGGKSPDCADSFALSFLPELIDRKVTTARVRPVSQRRIVWQR